MPRKPFIILFVILATLFVPVLFNFGVVCFIVPTFWGIVSSVKELITLDWKPGLVLVIYTALYMGAFALIALLLDFLARLARNHKVLWTIQTILLLGLFSCSFARVLTYGSIQGRGGTYTFWTAVARFMEKRAG